MRLPLLLLREPRLLLLLLLAAWGSWAEERQCSVDSECGYREECRKAVVHGVAAAVKTCQCHHFVFADGHEPRCVSYNWRTALATILMIINFTPFAIALTQYRVAYKEHMTDPPLRLGETRFKRAISLRTLFLAFSTLAALSAFAFNSTCIITLFAPVSTRFFYHNPLSPIQLGSSLHALGAASAFLVIVCIWVRVAAKLHDPASSTKKALYQLAFALGGSGLGLYLAVFFALPAGAVVMYFNLKGDWDRAFIGAAIFVGCGLILTSLAAKLLVARRMHQYEMQKNGPNLPTPKSWAFCNCLRRNHPAQHLGAAGPAEDSPSRDPETGENTEENDESKEQMVRERRQALHGDVAASVASEPLMSTFPSFSQSNVKSEGGRAVTGRGGGRSNETEKSAEEDDSRTGGEQSRGTQVSSNWGQGQDMSGASFIELRVRIIQWEAATLGKRVIMTAAVGICTFVFAMPYGPWRYAYLVQWAGLCFGGVGLVVANANCLCYISPAVRRNVRVWAEGPNPLLSCIAVLLWRSHS